MVVAIVDLLEKAADEKVELKAAGYCPLANSQEPEANDRKPLES